jgi:hypothetical protein
MGSESHSPKRGVDLKPKCVPEQEEIQSAGKKIIVVVVVVDLVLVLVVVRVVVVIVVVVVGSGNHVCPVVELENNHGALVNHRTRKGAGRCGARGAHGTLNRVVVVVALVNTSNS